MGRDSSASSHSRKKEKKEKKKDKKHKKDKKDHHHRDHSNRKSKKLGDERDSTVEQYSTFDAYGQYSHKDAVDLIKKNVDQLLCNDPLLSDLPSTVTLEELKSLIALEKGQAKTIIIEKADGTCLSVIVPAQRTATVRDLKKAVERATILQLSRDNSKRKTTQIISWKYIWKTYWLYFQGQKLQDDHRLLYEYGIQTNDKICFIKRLKSKWIWSNFLCVDVYWFNAYFVHKIEIVFNNKKCEIKTFSSIRITLCCARGHFEYLNLTDAQRFSVRRCPWLSCAQFCRCHILAILALLSIAPNNEA